MNRDTGARQRARHRVVSPGLAPRPRPSTGHPSWCPCRGRPRAHSWPGSAQCPAARPSVSPQGRSHSHFWPAFHRSCGRPVDVSVLLMGALGLLPPGAVANGPEMGAPGQEPSLFSHRFKGWHLSRPAAARAHVLPATCCCRRPVPDTEATARNGPCPGLGCDPGGRERHTCPPPAGPHHPPEAQGCTAPALLTWWLSPPRAGGWRDGHPGGGDLGQRGPAPGAQHQRAAPLSAAALRGHRHL